MKMEEGGGEGVDDKGRGDEEQKIEVDENEVEEAEGGLCRI